MIDKNSFIKSDANTIAILFPSDVSDTGFFIAAKITVETFIDPDESTTLGSLLRTRMLKSELTEKIMKFIQEELLKANQSTTGEKS